MVTKDKRNTVKRDKSLTKDKRNTVKGDASLTKDKSNTVKRDASLNEGESTNVELSIKEYDAIMEKLEELEDVKLYDEAKKNNDVLIPIDDAFKIIESQRKKVQLF